MTRKKRRGFGKRKGSAFEREVCVALSKWWTQDRSEDVFWRSTNSGARATVRRRKGKNTHGSHGDVAALDPIGEPLLDLCVIELKRGYNRYSSFDLVDRRDDGPQTTWDEWIQQAVDAAEFNATFGWVIIARRDKHEAVVVMPSSLERCLHYKSEDVEACLTVKVRFKPDAKRAEYTDRWLSLRVIRLRQFLTVDPDLIKELSRTL